MADDGYGGLGIRWRLPVADGLFFFFNRQRAGEEVYFSLEKSNFSSASSFLREAMSFFD
jgi:hypothetical protein